MTCVSLKTFYILMYRIQEEKELGKENISKCLVNVKINEALLKYLMPHTLFFPPKKKKKKKVSVTEIFSPKKSWEHPFP